MEARVEAGDLRHAGKPLGDRVDRGQVVRLMQRRQRHELPQAPPAPAVVTMVGPVYRAPPWTTRWPTPSTRAPPYAARSQSASESSAVRPSRTGLVQPLVGDDAAGAVLGGESRRRADALDLTARFEAPGVGLRSLVDAELEAR